MDLNCQREQQHQLDTWSACFIELILHSWIRHFELIQM